MCTTSDQFLQALTVLFNNIYNKGEVPKDWLRSSFITIPKKPNTRICTPFEVQKKLEEVRLLESRKSARLADQDTDFARLADMSGDRKRPASHTIDVPVSAFPYGSRKRRPSSSQDDNSKDSQMDECSAALVLMSLSCSPHSPNLNAETQNDIEFRTNGPDASVYDSRIIKSDIVELMV
ncbi:hypothetical protein HHI36_004038 [Cryptolaemus montrouzieri]|uniref:Uncharacterized protein n=1 Tax=Cryptolaemus montrouzieri TaxID=559131 RepID=A0ABD2NPY8_9CUCU